MTGDLQQILELFRNPTTAATAAERFGWSRPVVEGLLLQLQARGLVGPAEPGVGACGPGCGVCSMQNFCPRSETVEGEETAAVASNPEVWRLTPLGERSVRAQRHPAGETHPAG